MPTLYKRPNGVYYIKFHPGPGLPAVRKSTGTTDRAIARELFSDFERAFHRGELGIPAKKRIPMLGELFDEYLTFIKDHRKQSTYEHVEIYIRLFLRPAFGDLRADQLTNKHIEDFVGSLKNCKDEEGNPAPYHPETINKRLKCLGAIYNRAIRNGVLASKPVHIQLLRAPRPLPKYITPDEFAAWSQHITKPLYRWRAIIELCTGIPDSELAKLTWDESYVEEFGLLRYGREKTTEGIVVKLNLWATEVMEELKKIRNGPYIFHGIKEARKAYEVASANSGIKVTPHMLRHSFATWALSDGESIQKISAILGHASISTTQIYARVIPTFLAGTTGAIDRMRPPDKAPQGAKKAVSKHKPCTPGKKQKSRG